MKRLLIAALITLAGLALLVVSCGGARAQALPFITIEKSFTPHDSSVFSTVKEPTLLIVTAPEEAPPLEGWLSPSHLQEARAVTDFTTDFVLAWFWGERGSYFEVEIKRVDRLGQSVTAHVDYRPRPPTAQPLFSSAFHVVRVARPEDLKGDVLFTMLDIQTGENLAQVSHFFP